MKKLVIYLIPLLLVGMMAGCVDSGTPADTTESSIVNTDTNTDSNTNIKTEKPKVLTLSITTSVYATGLAEAISEKFKEKYNTEVRFIPKGTGGAILDAKSGASDAIIVHAVGSEEKFMNEGYGVNRKVFAYNFFIIVGPDNDPASIKGLEPQKALQKIVEAGRAGNTVWVTRDDNSGTNKKEINLWAAAGYDYEELKKEGWMRSTGQGMGDTLKYTTSENVRGYTLSDTGTYLKYQKEGLINLEKLVDKGEELTNVYAIILINPKQIDGKDFKESSKLAEWLVSDEGQDFIGNYGKEEFGVSLFSPAVPILTNKEAPIYQWIVKYGFMKDGSKYTECPTKFRYDTNWNFFEFDSTEITG
ncbi:ABC-type tungstate transport system permease component-like protein [Methanococcus aeolicus Nankai-3]|jgi:tungstate transport system substrate-binding protein|uniref:ABC-type tungstate transport system permease component-like protein n=1 Tax=Methanococcus aeolicus (strain ATCC BAA-1280 / DSM 17508 / OCM 812 / Nankai-3) TaxID=419665 RepID=A6UU87_META3|nr:substrate-binding domain-containing protein [Methanococcus aeolicus]ABR56059.1 ABC-type tungstate transport system permease component-like protein [Methanococcus aeolicus Nankai-3]